ncbi:hypothetical protein NQ315_010705 [Exocentrus adspersus]|uniref:Lipocalin/cytosolic fatty-acid binding domain-containing protein n=1 Tax=Exocentrus adspersus TaxID=1586481 RepID=A0AAV8VUB1_9CUCU|nr:hypothetical protein NQ315_010705 [Exocentrus adspersus]
MLLSKEHCATVVVLSILCIECNSTSGVGPCPKMSYMKNFNLSKFTGHWYEIERSFYLMELIQSCVNMDLMEDVKGRLEVSINTKSTWSGGFSISEGIATPSKKDPSLLLYKVSSKLPRVINKYLPGAGFYQVLSTDYNRYAILYSCTNFQLVHIDLIWIWGRTREIGAELRSKIYDLLTQYHLDSERLILPKNHNCTDD